MPTVFITGGHKGLGLEAVGRIAATARFDLVLAGRRIEEVQVVVDRLRRVQGINAHALQLDLSDLTSVRAAASAFQRLVAEGSVEPLSRLMLNAGAQFLGDLLFSADGYEQTFATNCLGNFLLTHLLLDDMQRGGRVVFTASGTHDPETVDGRMVGKAIAPDAIALADQGRNGTPASGGIRYATSKLCTMLYAFELHRRLEAADAGIASVAFDPGLVVETGLIRTAPPFAQRLMRTRPAKALFRRMGVTMGSIPFSGGALAEVAIDSRFADASGKYIQSRNGRLVEARSSTASLDRSAAAKLWVDSERLVKLALEERPQVLQKTRAGRTTRPVATVARLETTRCESVCCSQRHDEDELDEQPRGGEPSQTVTSFEIACRQRGLPHRRCMRRASETAP